MSVPTTRACQPQHAENQSTEGHSAGSGGCIEDIAELVALEGHHESVAWRTAADLLNVYEMLSPLRYLSSRVQSEHHDV